MSDYAHLLAATARQFGGASPDSWLGVIAPPSSDLPTLARLRPLAATLAEVSGFSSEPLFSGVVACPGAEALYRAHAGAFGPGLTVDELFASGLHDSDRLPGELARRLAKSNSRRWRIALLEWQRAWLPAIDPLVAEKWSAEQSPSAYELPPAATTSSRGALCDSLDAAVDSIATELIASTQAALRAGRLPGGNLQTKASRCLDVAFLSRYFRRSVWRGLESMRLSCRLVGGDGDNYVSRAGYATWHRRQQEQRRWQERTLVIDTHRKCEPRRLSDVVMSNHAKRCRLLAVLAGIEELAVSDGLAAAMLTFTLPSHWHANPASGGTRWGGGAYTPDAGARTLASQWATCLRDLDNVGVKLAGLRVVEPHKDGCPHLHVLAYYRPSDEAVLLARVAGACGLPAVKVRTLVTSAHGAHKTRRGVRYDAIVTHYDRATGTELPGDGGAHQVEFSRINREVSAASSYVQKYVAKSIDFDELGDKPELTSATAAAAHASGWGYRRYAFFGIRSSLTLWDSLRRTKELPPTTDAVGKALWQHALAGEYAEFLRILGGLSCSGGMRVQPLYAPRKDRYGDCVRDVVGVAVYDGPRCVLWLSTREPGRWKLIDESELLVSVENGADPPDE